MVENSYKSIKTKSEVSTGNGKTSLGQDKVWSNLKMTNCHVTSKYLPHSKSVATQCPEVLSTADKHCHRRKKGKKACEKNKNKNKEHFEETLTVVLYFHTSYLTKKMYLGKVIGKALVI